MKCHVAFVCVIKWSRTQFWKANLFRMRWFPVSRIECWAFMCNLFSRPPLLLRHHNFKQTVLCLVILWNCVNILYLTNWLTHECYCFREVSAIRWGCEALCVSELTAQVRGWFFLCNVCKYVCMHRPVIASACIRARGWCTLLLVEFCKRTALSLHLLPVSAWIHVCTLLFKSSKILMWNEEDYRSLCTVFL